MEKGRDEKALHLLADYTRKNSSETHPQLPFLKGLIQYRLKRFNDSEKSFKKAVKHNPCFGEAWQNLAAVYNRQHRPEKAAEAMEKAFTLIKPENPALQYQAAVFRIMAKEPKKAIFLLQKLVGMPDAERQWFLLLADTLKKQKKTGKAAIVLQNAANRFKDPELQYQAALIHVHAGGARKALPLLKGLTARPKPKVKWFEALSHVYASLSQPTNAAKSMEKAVRLKPDASRKYRAACLWIKADQPKKALPLLKEVCATKNPRSEWRASLAHVLESLGKNHEAAMVLAGGNRGEEKPADAFRSALLHLKNDNPQKALPLLETLSAKTDPNPQWLMALASTLDRLNRPAEAVAIMGKVDTKSPTLSSNMRLQAAIFWLKHDNPKRALPLLERIAKDPHVSKSCRLAQIEALVRTDQPQAANVPLKTLLDQYPHDEQIWRLAAWTNIEQKAYGKAAAALEVAFRLEPPKSGDWKQLGNLYRLAGVPRKAAYAYVHAFGKNLSAGDLDLLAQTYRDAHQMEEALRAADRAAKLAPTAKRLARLGRMHMEQQDCQKGMAAFQKAAQLDDPEGINSLRMGYAAWKLDRLASAKTAFQSVLQKADSRSRNAVKASKALKTIEQMINRQ
ncbi:MAG: tetratricopeptide repeat protein [Deltaproteobacteria bacterium]|nr:tetratricopeptide repeat protein [Deltaproteobacteria bacterium]